MTTTPKKQPAPTPTPASDEPTSTEVTALEALGAVQVDSLPRVLRGITDQHREIADTVLAKRGTRWAVAPTPGTKAVLGGVRRHLAHEHNLKLRTRLVGDKLYFWLPAE